MRDPQRQSRYGSRRVRRSAAWAFVCLLGLTSGCRHHDSISGRRCEKVIGEQGLGPGQFVFPRAMATAADGTVFIIDKTARIQRFSPDGEYETSWQMPEWAAGKPTGISIDRQGRVLIGDTHYHRVLIFDRDGRELARFGSQGGGPGQFEFVTDVDVDADGNIYVGEYGGNDRISKFSPDFQFIQSIGGPETGEAALLRPQAFKFDARGDLVVADALHHRICRFTRDGRFLGAFGNAGHGPGELKYPYDVAICADGSLLVCEFGNNRLQRFDVSGKSLEVWGAAGRRVGELANPWGMALGADRRVFVVDYLNHRVQMFRM